MNTVYRDRHHAGETLAGEIAARGYTDIVLLAVPRGGIVVAAPVARRLGVPLGVLVTRKLGHPANPEVAIGAVMADGTAVLDHDLIRATGVTDEYLDRAIAREHAEIGRRMTAYTGSSAPPAVAGRTALVVDDGIATGYTIRAAIAWLKTLGPARVVVAVPVAPPDTVAALAGEVDEVICSLQPENFMAVGMHYREFPQNTDDEILAILKETNAEK